MSFADLDSPPHVLRSSSTSLLSTAALHNHELFSANSDTPPTHWDDYNHFSAPFEDHLGDFIAGTRFDQQFGSAADTSAEFKGLGLDMDLDTAGSDDEEPRSAITYAEGAFAGRGESATPKRACTRLQSKSGRPQRPQTLLPGVAASPDPSQSSYRLTSAADNAPSTDSSPFFPGGLPSPFQQPSTPNSATMGPAHSVRSSSPSSTSSHAISRVGPTSAASSVYGGEGSSVLVASQSTSTSRSSAPPSQPDPSTTTVPSSSSRHRHMKSASASTAASASGSPKKRRGGGVRKLTDRDRKDICLHREANPTLKQDLIAERFNVERSTVSKILKDKAHWLAVGDDDDDIFPVTSPVAIPASSPRKAHAIVFSSSSAAPIAAFAAELPSTPIASSRMSRGRYPEVERLLFEWARVQAEAGMYLSDELLHAQALSIAATIKGYELFRGSGTWVEGFKSRAGVTAGTFLDLYSRGTAVKIQADVDAEAAEEEAREEHELEVEEPADDDDRDDDFDVGFSSRKSKRQAASRRLQIDTTCAPLTVEDLGMARETSPSVRIESRTPLRLSFASSNDSDATPTHSILHSRVNSKTPHTLAWLSTARTPEELRPSSSPSSFQNHTTSPPQGYTHNRSGSTASTTSSYSGLSAFSSQGGTFLNRSMYGSYPTSTQSNTSTPSTPVTGYYSHGNGSQSQLQAAFIDPSTALPPAQSSPTGVTRRATISGGLPFQGGPPILTLPSFSATSSLPARQLPFNPSGGPTSSFDQALASLQNVLEYLGQEGQVFVQGPRDLVVLSDIIGKMMQHTPPPPAPHSASPPFSPYQAQSTSQRLRLSRASSSNSVSSSGRGTRRSQSSTSLFSSLDSVSSSMVPEEHNMD